MNLPDTIQVLSDVFISDKLASSLDDLYPFVVCMTRESPAAAGFMSRGYTNSTTNTMSNKLTIRNGDRYDSVSRSINDNQ